MIATMKLTKGANSLQASSTMGWHFVIIVNMNYKRLAISLLLPQLAGAIGAMFTSPNIGSWYDVLEKPFFTPPDWVFGPVWITLYLLMGVSSYMVWQKTKSNHDAKKAVLLYWIHLCFNASWSIVFFGLQMTGIALVNIFIILFFIILLIVKFSRFDYRASLLLVPYLLWVCLATLLNFSIWYLN